MNTKGQRSLWDGGSGNALLVVVYEMSGRDLRTFLSDHRRTKLNFSRNEG